MNDKFFDLKKEKQDKIINAALKIFSLSDYRRASTDDIVKAAGISKGLLFHYFTNKAGIYGFLYAYSTKYTSIELYQTVSIKEKDYFELLVQIERAHLKVMTEYPYMISFLENAAAEKDPEVLAELGEKPAKWEQQYRTILNRGDRSGFRNNVEEEMAVSIIEFTMQGIKRSYLERENFSPEEQEQTLLEYLKVLKSWLYES